MIKVVKVAEPMGFDPNSQVAPMVAKARSRAYAEGMPIGSVKVMIVVEQEFEDGK